MTSSACYLARWGAGGLRLITRYERNIMHDSSGDDD